MSQSRRNRMMSRSRPLLLAVALMMVPAAAAQRLPLIAFPEHYELRFVPDLATGTFKGEANIRVRVLQPTTEIVLHAAELEIKSAGITAAGQAATARVALDPASETMTLALPQTVAPGLAEVRIVYSGVLNRQLRGFYLSEANDRLYAVTQLEATDARRMFPSFDEPQFKATFDVTAVIDSEDAAISNGPIVSAVPGPEPGKQTIRFATTAEMSTYLVALAVGDFQCVDDEMAGTPLRICATPGKRDLTRFSMDATEGLLQYFNEYFATDYPFAKLDQVAIPDFAAGAMENTGAIFYRESILLVDPTHSTLAARKRAAAVIAHEIAHHWFGNLVTMRWWDDLWLNEGFATWMEAKAVAAWKPGWPVRQDEVQAVQSAMAVDALATTRPIRTRAETPGEINELFDPIAYEKGAAILRMVEAYVGESRFRGGVNAYLEWHAYDNATAENFWTTLTRATDQPVDRIMSSFVDQPGVPLVTVSTACRNGRTAVTLSQERHRQGVAAGPEPLWVIPVCLRWPGSGESPRCELLSERTMTVTLEGCSPWLFANAGARGYYRTAYAAPAARALAASGHLSPPESITLLADEWALLRAGRHDVGRFLEISGSIARATEVAGVAESAAARLNYVHEYLTTPASVEVFETWVRGTLADPLVTGGAESADSPLSPSDTDADRRRAALMLALGIAGRDQEVLREARRRVEAYLRGGDSLDPAWIDPMVHLAATAGDGSLYEQYLERSRSAQTPAERYRFLNALAAFRQPDLLRRTIRYALSDQLRSQDRAALLAAVLGNPAGRDDAWTVIQAEWPQLGTALAGFGGTSRIIEGLGAFCDRQAASAIRAFFAAHPPAGAERTLAQTLERIEACAAFAADQQPRLGSWLSTTVGR